MNQVFSSVLEYNDLGPRDIIISTLSSLSMSILIIINGYNHMMMIMRVTVIMLIYHIDDNNDNNRKKDKDNIHLVLFIHVNRSDSSLAQKFL